MLLYIVRHGDPDYANDCLTELGKKQADAVAKRLAARGLDKIFSSPMGRARQTAQPTCDLLGIPYAVEDWMSEVAAWDELSIPNGSGGRTWAFHARQNSYYRAAQERLEQSQQAQEWFGVEPFPSTSEAAYERIRRCSDDFLGRLGYRREGAVYRIAEPNDWRVAAFCHQGFGTTWLSHLLAVPPLTFWAGFDMAHTSVTILEFANHADGTTAPKCLCLSDLSHIYREGLPMRYNRYIDI